MWLGICSCWCVSLLTARINLLVLTCAGTWAATWDFQQCGMCGQQRLRPACAYAQSDQSHCCSLEYSMTLKLLTEQHLEFLSLKGGCTGSSVYSCQNATLLEITCHGSILFSCKIFSITIFTRIWKIKLIFGQTVSQSLYIFGRSVH